MKNIMKNIAKAESPKSATPILPPRPLRGVRKSRASGRQT
jgi:hypothetical protein